MFNLDEVYTGNCLELIKDRYNRSVCAKALDHHYIGFEIVPEYVETAKKRIYCELSGIDENKVIFWKSAKPSKSLF